MSVAEGTTEIDDLVALTVCVARLGEADMRNWWGSRCFGAAGRVVLKQRLPRTWRMAAVELDLASATNRHNDAIDRPNAVHLFSDNWPVRRWTTAWVAEQKTQSEPSALFAQLETITLDQVESRLRTDSKPKVDAVAGALRAGSIDRAHLDDRLTIADAVATLAAAYIGLENFAAPYLEVVG